MISSSLEKLFTVFVTIAKWQNTDLCQNIDAIFSNSKFLLFEDFRTMVSIWSGCPPLNFIVPICCFVYHSRHQIPCTSLPSPWQTGHTLAQFPLLSYSHVNVLKLTLVCCNLLHRSSYKYASKRSSYIAIQSSCFSLETEHFLKCAKGV